MAADQLTDKEDQFKRRARRRLVGAVALVLLMVTVLPMVLDDRSGQKSAPPEIAISIPSQEGTEFTSKIVPVTPQAATPVDLASPVQQAADAPSETKPTTPAVTAVESNATESKPAASSAKPAGEIAPAKIEPAKAAVSEIKPTPTTPATIKKGSVSVQIGVFSDAVKVKQMRAKIAEKGIQCYTENMNTPKGTKYRVRCGPFADKPAAQQALETLKANGYNGILVTNQ